MPRLDFRHYLALSLTQKLRKDVVRQHPLRQLFWECTLRCNLSCRHCGSDCHVTANTRDMPKEDFGRVLDSVAAFTDPHNVMINITGGEPLMRPDLEACGRMIYVKGFPWGIVTNALALTPERYQRLLQCGLRSMTISLDGLESDHDWMRGRKGSFERAAAAIKMVVESGEIEFDVVTCVNKRSYRSLNEIKELLIKLGLKEWRLFTVFPSGRALGDPDMQLGPDKFRGLMEFIRSTRKEGRIKASYGCEGFLGNFEGDVRDHFFFCQAGVSVAGILADGSISACPSIRSDYHQGNIYRDDFVEVWQNSYKEYRDRSWMRESEPCRSCKYFRFCQGGAMHLRTSDGRLPICHVQDCL
ncbi:MAG: TIGR04133 family radical SAM/SPASM protein [Bacteroidales bacterium]|nr:TIGR04133 family radical SAM/SPASM protein [Bacteroidales bacterium]